MLNKPFKGGPPEQRPTIKFTLCGTVAKACYIMSGRGTAIFVGAG